MWRLLFSPTKRLISFLRGEKANRLAGFDKNSKEKPLGRESAQTHKHQTPFGNNKGCRGMTCKEIKE